MVAMMKTVAKALVVDKTGKLLMLYRGMTHPNFPGHLDLPGGEVEEGEDWTVAVAREIREETSLTIDTSSFRKVFQKSYPDVTHVLYIANAPLGASSPNLSWEHDHYKWYTREELLKEQFPANIDPYFRDVINSLKSGTN